MFSFSLQIDGTQPRYRIKLDQTLQIITLHKTDSGIYLCTAENGVGDPITIETKLNVLGKLGNNFLSSFESGCWYLYLNIFL